MNLSPDDRTLAVPDNTSHTRFIDTTTRRPRKVLSNFGYGVAPSYSPDGSLVVGYGGTKAPEVDVLDARTYRVRRKLSYDRRWLSAPTDGGKGFLVTRDNHTVFFVYNVLVGPNRSEGPAYVDRWDLRTGKLVASVPVGAPGAVDAVFVDGQRQIAVAGTRRVTFLQTATLKKLRSLPLPVSATGSFALGPGARTAALGSTVGSVSFIDLANGHVTRGLGGHPAPVVGVRFSPDGRRLVTTAEDGSVIVWDAKTAQPLERLNGHASRTLGISFSRDGQTLYTSSLDGAVFEWDLGTTRRFGVPFTTFTRPPKLGFDAQQTQQLPPLAVSPDGSRFAVRVEAGKVALYSTSTLRRVTVIQPYMPEVIGIAWSSAGVLALTGDSGQVRLWDVRGQPRFVGALRGLRSTNGQPEVVTEAAFSPDGKLLAAADINHTPGNTPYRLGTVAVWETHSRKLVWKATTKNWISTVAFAPDGNTIAAGREDGTVVLHDARTGKVKRELRLDGGGPESSTFAPDGTLATGNWAGIVQLWNLRTGRQVGHPTLVAAAPVASISFDPLGTRFATAGGSDGLAKLWATNTLQQLGAAFPGERGQWGNAQFTPDGSKVIVVFQNGKAVAWPVTLAAWKAHACEVAGRNLTREEWSRYVSGRKYTAVCPPS